MQVITQPHIELNPDFKVYADLTLVCLTLRVNSLIKSNGFDIKILCKELYCSDVSHGFDSSSPDLDNQANRNGRNGNRGRRHGESGQNGQDGKIGKDAGNISIYASYIHNRMTLKASGADGGNGGKGGDGMNGKDASSRVAGDCHISTDCSTIYRGAKGGDSGKPGAGSNGSDGGNIEVRYLESSQLQTADMDNDGGNAGKNGPLGIPGRGGTGQKYILYGNFPGGRSTIIR